VKPRIISFCGGSGAWEAPYVDAGYEVINVTLPEHDVRTYKLPGGSIRGILAAPPCNEYSFVKNEKLKRDLVGADAVLNACRALITEAALHHDLEWWALENPIGHIVSRIGQPQFIFQPWEFGDPWTKRTGIWGDFKLPVKTHSSWEAVTKNPALYVRPGRGKPNMVWLHKSAQASIPSFRQFAPAANDAAFRAITPQGFAKAFFKENP